MFILPSLFRLRTGLRHVVKTTVITRSKGLVSMKNGSHGLECDVIRFAHGRKNVQMTSFPCQFAQSATGVGQGELLINLSLFVMSLPVVGRVDAVIIVIVSRIIFLVLGAWWRGDSRNDFRRDR